MQKKKSIQLIILMLLCSSLYSYSQGAKGFYAFGNTGYKFGSVFTTFPNEYFIDENNVSNAYIRLGGGNSLTMAAGWMFHDHLGIEISTTYTIGGTKDISNGTISSNSFIEASKTSKSRNMHSIGSIVAQFPYKNFYFYAKAGVVIGYYNRTTLTDNYMINGNSESFQYTIDGNLMRGFNGSLGFLYKLSDQVSLMVEAEEVSIQGSFKEGFLTQNRSSLSLPRNIVYQENVSNATNTSSTQYFKEFPVSYSCIGLNIGIHYSFSK